MRGKKREIREAVFPASFLSSSYIRNVAQQHQQKFEPRENFFLARLPPERPNKIYTYDIRNAQ